VGDRSAGLRVTSRNGRWIAFQRADGSVEIPAPSRRDEDHRRGMTEPGGTSRIVAVCVDANDPVGLAHFWAAALRWDVDDNLDQIALVPTDDTRFGIRFPAVSGTKAGQNRLHFDLTTTSIEDQHESVARLVGLGARHIDIGQRPDEGHVVLADPEGNEFCIIEPGNNFLAGCGRLGSVTCDGTRAAGYFWSAALGWPLVWDQDEETAIRAPDVTGPLITWGGPPLAPKIGKNRLHLDIAPDHGDLQAEVDRLVSLGATPIDIGQGDVDWVVMADPDGNEFCVMSPDSQARQTVEPQRSGARDRRARS
jgi:predicted enzyme related to lactoylglutathione lyase